MRIHNLEENTNIVWAQYINVTDTERRNKQPSRHSSGCPLKDCVRATKYETDFASNSSFSSLPGNRFTKSQTGWLISSMGILTGQNMEM